MKKEKKKISGHGTIHPPACLSLSTHHSVYILIWQIMQQWLTHKKCNFLVASLVCLFDCLCVYFWIIISLHKSSSKILTSLFACVGSVYGVWVCVCVCVCVCLVFFSLHKSSTKISTWLVCVCLWLCLDVVSLHKRSLKVAKSLLDWFVFVCMCVGYVWISFPYTKVVPRSLLD
jgi:hypothetical protein